MQYKQKGLRQGSPFCLLRNEDVWTPWVSADAKAKIDAEIAKEQGMAAQQKD